MAPTIPLLMNFCSTSFASERVPASARCTWGASITRSNGRGFQHTQEPNRAILWLFWLIPITSDLARRPALALLPALPSIAERTVAQVLPIVLASVHHDGGGVSQRLK